MATALSGASPSELSAEGQINGSQVKEVLDATTSSLPRPTTTEVETAIRRLDDLKNYAAVAEILHRIELLERASDQQWARELLNNRVQQLQAHASPYYEELLAKIDTLTLGPVVTARDLRARDEIVLNIAAVTDPVQREQLLKRLDAREREAQRQTESSDAPIGSADYTN